MTVDYYRQDAGHARLAVSESELPASSAVAVAAQDERDNAANQQDEAALMLAAQRDAAAFAPLYERYFTRIYRYCLRRVGGMQEAEDLTSQVFIRALRGLEGYRGGLVAAWLFRIAHNVVANHLRGLRPQVSIEAGELDFAADYPEPLKALLDAERAALLRELVGRLSEYQQDLLALKLSGELTSQEIGEALGKSAGAVRVDLHRAINQLRALFLEANEGTEL